MRTKILSLLVLLLMAASGAWAQTETLLTTLTFGESPQYGETTSGVVSVTAINVSEKDAEYGWLWTGSGSLSVTANEGYTITKCIFRQNEKTPITDTEAPFEIHVNSGNIDEDPNRNMDGVTSIEVYGYASAPAVEVTTNAASEGATFTEAWFNMPAFDATAEYELVRDMSIQMTAQVGDGTQEQPRYRVKKDGNNKFIPADMEMAAVPALFTVNDAIEQKALTQTQDYIVQIYAIDAEGQPTGAPMTFATFTFEPGIYAVKAVAATNEYYDGETALSNTFKLYDYINITFPKGYSTHYYNESLVLDEIRNSLKFYAVTAVTSEKVTLTEIEGKAIPGGTPFIVYNETAEPITAVMGMLQADDVTSAEEFKGTAEDKTMAAQSGCYVLRNGDTTPTFRLVEGAGTLPAHRCWIELGTAAGTRTLGFDFGDATGMSEALRVKSEESAGDWYDLQGRKLQGAPLRKGAYIHNGKTIIIK